MLIFNNITSAIIDKYTYTPDKNISAVFELKQGTSKRKRPYSHSTKTSSVSLTNPNKKFLKSLGLTLQNNE